MILSNNGYCFTYDNFGYVTRIDKNGEHTKVGKATTHAQWGRESLAVPAEGLMYCGGIFYDIKTLEAVIDLSEYHFTSTTILSDHSFSEGGMYTFYFYNPNGTEYRGTIDKTGKFVSTPQPK